MAAAVAAALPSAAAAHSALLESTPEAGARLASSPKQIRLQFTEPLNRDLTKASVRSLPSGTAVRASLSVASRRQLVLRPAHKLRSGAYRLEWHTVSTLDGHALEGSFSFGVRAAAIGGEHQVEQSPLARAGWVRVAVRAAFYAALFFFAGGVLLDALLRGRGPPGDWLVPPELRSNGGKGTSPISSTAWRRTQTAGWLALTGAIAVAVADAADAGDGLSAHTLSSFLLSNIAGEARLGAIAAVLVAALLAARASRLAAAGVLAAFLAVALGGHANSAPARGLAVTTDWLHLAAAALWVGGIAQIAVTWAPRLKATATEARQAVMTGVLDRFGRVALPAFGMVVLSGVGNALTELNGVSALWTTAYGRVLAVKIALVGAIAAASYLHALRWRPRLRRAGAQASSGSVTRELERRHWRLLRSEAPIGAAVVTAAALLVAFPLPPSQLRDSDEARATQPTTCENCPLQKPQRTQLAVADHVGSTIAAAWLEQAGRGIRGRLRLLGLNRVPVRTPPQLEGAKVASCGTGCFDFSYPRRPEGLRISLREKGRVYTTTLPASWQPRATAVARRLVVRAQRTMRRLRSVRETERVTSGPGSFARTDYRLEAPDRMAYKVQGGAQAVVVRQREWMRAAPTEPWRPTLYGGGPPPFRTRSWFRWTIYARSVRLLERSPTKAEVALMDPGTPVWFRLWIDVNTMRVTKVRMIADGHFMTQRYFAFNSSVFVRPPRGR